MVDCEQSAIQASPFPPEDCDAEARGLARIAAFLVEHGLAIENVIDAVGERSGERCLLFVGSVPEGTSTRLSDADLIVIGTTPGPAELIVEQNGVGQVIWTMGERLEVCAAYYSPTVFESIAERLRRGLSAVRSPPSTEEPIYKMETLDVGLLKFAHRLKTGVTLRGNVQPIRELLYLQYLDDYLVAHGILEHLICLEDVQGELESGSLLSAAYTFAGGMSYLAGAALAAIGETNPDQRWRVRLLERSRQRIGSELADELCHYLMGPGTRDLMQWIRDGFKFSAKVAEHCLASRPLASAVVQGVRKAITLTITPP